MTTIQALATFGGALALAGGLAGSAMGIANAGSAGTATLSEDAGQLRNVIVLASLPCLTERSAVAASGIVYGASSNLGQTPRLRSG